MKNHLSDLSTNRNEIQRLESQRNLLSKQISMVRELDALGSAMSSHPLNTLSQRYVIYKKKRNDVGLIRNILMEKAVESERMMADFLSFVEDINSGSVNNNLADIKSNYGAKTKLSEFDLIKEFLESSNQGQTYLQSEQLRKELDTSVVQQQAIVVTIFETLIQYFKVIRFYPHDHVAHHRFAKYSQWCRSLMNNKSQDFVHQVALAYHSNFGDAVLKEQVPEHIIRFSYQLQSILVDISYQRDLNQKKYKQLIEQIDVKQNYNAVKDEFRVGIQDQSPSIAMRKMPLLELTNLVKRLLGVELLAFRTPSEHLIDLVIHDRHYSNELMIQTAFLSNISEIIFDVGSKKKHPLFASSLECLKAVTEAFEGVIHVENEFQLNVIPQTLQGIISQDKSILEMISIMSNIQNIMSLPELLLILHEDLRKCIHDVSQKEIPRAAELTEAYTNMVTQYEALPEGSIGKKIFLAFHGMFERVSKVMKKTISYDKTLSEIPEEWSKISEIQQSRSLFISPTSSSICFTLEQIMLVRRIQTMIEFFSSCVQITWAFKGSGELINFDMDFLTRPLKTYFSECLTKYVFGRGSYSLSVMICCMFEQKQLECKSGNNLISLDQLCFMTTSKSEYCEKFVVALEERFRKEEAAGYFKKLAHKQSEYVKHLTHILSAHHWLHEEHFVAQPNVLPPIPRATLLIQLQQFIQSLSNWNTSIQKINEELKQCTLVVLQRLKWASGANPMVNEMMKNFESISNSKAIQLETGQQYAATALKHCYSVLNYEMLRFKTPKAIISDEEFLNFLQQWENVCIAERNIAQTVNPIEEALVELLDPEGKVERAWINNVTSLIDDMINQVHSDIDTKEKGVMSARDSLDMCAHKLRSFIASHHRISADIRNLLKSILKHDDSTQNKALREYLVKYKVFIENVTELHGNVLSKDFTDVMVKRTIEQVGASLAVINEIYNDLFTFEKMLSSALTDGGRRMVRNHSENLSIDYPGSPIKKGLCLSTVAFRHIKVQQIDYLIFFFLCFFLLLLGNSFKS